MRNLISSTLMLLAVASAAQADHAQDGKQLRERDRQFLDCPTYMDTPQIQPRNLAAADISIAPTRTRIGATAKSPAPQSCNSIANNPLTLYNLGRSYHDSGELERAERRKPRQISDSDRTERLHVMLPPEELKAIDDFRFANRIQNRAAAVRELSGGASPSPDPTPGSHLN